MNIHVLPGDALAETFADSKIEGETIVCRECLIDGEVKADDLDDFWRVRAKFIATTYNEKEENYRLKVVREFQKLLNFPREAKIYLWFENELFCQANMWFCLSLLENAENEIYRVMPIVENEEEIWKGFGGASVKDLRESFERKIKFQEKDVSLGVQLWAAFQNSDFQTLEQLSREKSDCFPYLKEVCRAAAEKNIKPKEILREIAKKNRKNFSELFAEFTRHAGVYGFGDAQVKRILEEI